MKLGKNIFAVLFAATFMFSWAVSNAGGQDYSGNEDPNKKILQSSSISIDFAIQVFIKLV